MLERLLCAWLVVAGMAARAQTAATGIRTGAQLATFRSDVDGSNQPYALYVPKSFAPGKKYPLVISLHEEDSNHRLSLRRILGVVARLGEPDIEDMRFFPPVRDVEFLVACPLARGTMGYQGIAEKDVYDVLADVKRRFPVDDDRVYLTGISMGGGGALWLALTRPDVWAAVAPVCPTATPVADFLAPNALNLPMRIFHGDQDPIVSVESSRAWHRRFLDLDVRADYIEYPGVRHNAWDFAYRDHALFDWFGTIRRNRFPDLVRFTTRSYRYNTAYWVRIDGLTPGMTAAIDARRSATGIQVTASNVDGFTLTLDRPVSQVTIDGAVLRIRPAASVSFTHSSGRWRVGHFEAAGKREGAEGPIAEAFAGRHLYVYGSLGTRTAEELEVRRKVAEAAAAWSTSRARLALTPPVKADSEVTAEDLDSANLVLFGTADTNSVIARVADALPLSLNPGAADYSLLFIAPLGKHYAVINSGLPWWTGADDAGRGGYPFAPEQFRLLGTFGDFILFKGALANVVAEGRFDRNWKVPADAAAKLLASGTVTIR